MFKLFSIFFLTQWNHLKGSEQEKSKGKKMRANKGHPNRHLSINTKLTPNNYCIGEMRFGEMRSHPPPICSQTDTAGHTVEISG